MYEHKVLIVDDDRDTERIAIREYQDIFGELRQKLSLPYSVKFVWKDSIGSAIEQLNKLDPYDVVVIDYDFANDEAGRKGVYLVKKIRNTINKRCKIVFYTMHAFHSFNKNELVELLNNDVFRFIDKSGSNLSLNCDKVGNESDQLIVEAIIDAINSLDPFSRTLENYLSKYYHILKKTKIRVEGKEYSIRDIIDSIRLDGEIGNKFVSNIVEMSILSHLDV